MKFYFSFFFSIPHTNFYTVETSMFVYQELDSTELKLKSWTATWINPYWGSVYIQLLVYLNVAKSDT